MMNNLIHVAIAEAKAAAKLETTLKGRLEAAMRATRNHWLVTDDDSRFQAAVAAAYELSDDSDRTRIERELSVLRCDARG